MPRWVYDKRLSIKHPQAVLNEISVSGGPKWCGCDYIPRRLTTIKQGRESESAVKQGPTAPTTPAASPLELLRRRLDADRDSVEETATVSFQRYLASNPDGIHKDRIPTFSDDVDDSLGPPGMTDIVINTPAAVIESMGGGIGKNHGHFERDLPETSPDGTCTTAAFTDR